jgi:hypothetical protein
LLVPHKLVLQNLDQKRLTNPAMLSVVVTAKMHPHSPFIADISCFDPQIGEKNVPY